jgi:diamine N-acetyltransferase
MGDSMIYGERVRFRGIEQEDLASFQKWINDPEILPGIGVFLPFASADEQDWYEKMRSRPIDEHNMAIETQLQPGEHVRPAGLDAETGWKLIGSWGFFNLDWHNRCTEFGIMIGEKAYWNQGYGTEAVRLLAHHGFYTLNLNRIYLRVLENNYRAIRAYEKAGFIHEGRQRQAEYKDGHYLDFLVMSMLRGEY